MNTDEHRFEEFSSDSCICVICVHLWSHSSFFFLLDLLLRRRFASSRLLVCAAGGAGAPLGSTFFGGGGIGFSAGAADDLGDVAFDALGLELGARIGPRRGAASTSPRRLPAPVLNFCSATSSRTRRERIERLGRLDLARRRVRPHVADHRAAPSSSSSPSPTRCAASRRRR